MRFQVNRRSAWLLTALLLGASCVVGRAATPEPILPPDVSSPTLGSDPEDVLQRALHLERQRNWTGAIELYGQALEQWPSRSEFGRRRRLCESHCKLVRRYQDQSFRKVLLRLPRQKAMDLYDELLDRIETHYVDPVSLEPLVRRGLDNMEVALRDPAFLDTNAPGRLPSG
jgi:carboxyl-terminal processing protease